MYELYKIADYVMRAEEYFCIGRTLYEGLYSGDAIIIQGNREDIKSISHYKDFEEKIFFYQPRNEESLLLLLQQLSKKKIVKGEASTTAPLYAKEFNGFVQKIVNRKK